jgi:MFS family permease
METREKRSKVSLDLLGVLTLSISIVALLSLFLVGGKDYAWDSPQIIVLLLLTILAGVGFVHCEKRAEDPILSLEFFRIRGFAIGNASVFMSSFAIFAFFAFAPIFIQGAQGKSPMQVGIALLSLSLGWSIGSIIFGQISNRLGAKTAAIMGAICLTAGCGLSLTFHTSTSMIFSFLVFQLVGLGMGFVALATLVIVQNSVEPTDLGVATASHQFMRTFGGTVGIGICGGLLMSRLTVTIDSLVNKGIGGGLPETVLNQSQKSIEDLLRPEFQALLPETERFLLQSSIASSVQFVFWVALFISLLCLAICFLLPESGRE